jgi:hypothetical protein
MSGLTAERLRELLHYDPATGVFRWRVRTSSRRAAGDIAGTAHNAGYWQIRVAGEVHLAHRLAWLYMTGAWPKDQIDHRNTDRADNRRENLREASRRQNQANKPLQKNNTSGFKGVSFSKTSGRWLAQIRRGPKAIPLGLFDTPEDAHAAYVRAAEREFGEFARAA